MRSLMLTLLAATIAAFTVTSALAQNQVNLGAEQTGTLAFVAQGGGNFTLGLCDNLNGAKKCVSGDTVIGKVGPNTGDFAPYGGFYILQGSSLTTGTSTGCVGTTCSWTLSGGGYNFDWNTQKNGLGTNYLSGTLTMLSMTEVPAGKVFDETITLELTVAPGNAGGILASMFADDHGKVVFNVQSQTTLSLEKSPNGRGIQGILESGDLTEAPEPGTMALLGSGFLLVGGFLRRKFSA